MYTLLTTCRMYIHGSAAEESTTSAYSRSSMCLYSSWRDLNVQSHMQLELDVRVQTLRSKIVYPPGCLLSFLLRSLPRDHPFSLRLSVLFEKVCLSVHTSVWFFEGGCGSVGDMTAMSPATGTSSDQSDHRKADIPKEVRPKSIFLFFSLGVLIDK